MKYFVTGATGFLGNILARQLLAKSHQVNIVVRSPEKARELESIGAKIFKGDVTEKESMRPAMQGLHAVFHAAGWYKIGTHDKSDGDKVNVQGTRNVLELMKELKIPKGVYTSTLAANSNTNSKLVDETYHFNGTHLSEYDRTKAVAQDIAKQLIAAGLPRVIASPGLVYGPNDTSNLRPTLVSYLKGQLPLNPRKTAFCWGHVDDIARGHILAMEKGKAGETYFICGEVYRMADALRLEQEITAIRSPGSVSPGMLLALSRLMSVIAKIIPLPESYTSEGLRVIAGVTYIGDNSKARRELGFDPRPLKDGLRETLRPEISLLGMKTA